MIVFNECSVIGKDLVIDAFVDVFDYLKDVEISSVIVDTDDTFDSTGPSEEPVYTVDFETVYGSSSTSEETAEDNDEDSDDSSDDEDSDDEDTDESETTDADEGADDDSSDDDDDSEEDDDEDSSECEAAPPLRRREKRNKHVRLRVSASDMGLSTLSENLFFVYVKVVGVPDISTPCNKDKEYTVGVAVDLKRLYGQGMGHIREIGRCEMPTGFIDWYLRLKAVELAVQTGNYEAAIAYWKKLFLNASTTSSITDCGCDGN